MCENISTVQRVMYMNLKREWLCMMNPLQKKKKQICNQIFQNRPKYKRSVTEENQAFMTDQLSHTFTYTKYHKPLSVDYRVQNTLPSRQQLETDQRFTHLYFSWCQQREMWRETM